MLHRCHVGPRVGLDGDILRDHLAVGDETNRDAAAQVGSRDERTTGDGQVKPAVFGEPLTGYLGHIEGLRRLRVARDDDRRAVALGRLIDDTEGDFASCGPQSVRARVLDVLAGDADELSRARWLDAEAA